jgi:hypothetical protein
MTKKPATKRIRIKLGDVFALPFEDGSFGVAQIGAIAFSVPTYVVFDARFRQVDEIARNLDAALSKPVASVVVAGSIRAVDGIWPRVASRPPQARLSIPVFTVEVGVSSYSDGVVTSIASTYTGAKQIMAPGFLQQFLLPGVPLPSTAADAPSTAPARFRRHRSRSLDRISHSSERTRSGGDHDPVPGRWAPLGRHRSTPAGARPRDREPAPR